MERSTRQRAAIQETLARLGRPLLPQELLAEAQNTVPNLSLATIYRNIKGLIADGVVDVVSLPGETDRYEIHKHHHHHFHCSGCHQVSDIDACPGDLSRLMPSGYLLEGHELTLYGRCPSCTSAAARPQVRAVRLKKRSLS
jgi:Fur family ferric uptake transcriptional regulator